LREKPYRTVIGFSTIKISAIFFTVWTVLSQDVRLSVRLYSTFRYSVEMAKHIKICTPSGGHTILVFLYETVYGNISMGTP